MASERQDISLIAALLRLSYEDEMTDDVRGQIREHCIALRDICDAQSKALAEARAEGFAAEHTSPSVAELIKTGVAAAIIATTVTLELVYEVFMLARSRPRTWTARAAE